ncbi:hypothetical protein VNI00_003435 [Paramarasmius palmivorus]|uniref:F-box domain-containing protein n=1 Tax=Paramarasmius palmivorus TaxID=297713 RepID=A0AAW0DSV4_9AGAR
MSTLSIHSPNLAILTDQTLSEQNIVEETLSVAESDLKACDAEIAALLSRRERLVQTIQKCKSALSLINNFPPEILSYIFEIVCETNTFGSSKQIAAITISAVGCHWRQIALSTPALWSSLKIDFTSWGQAERGLAHLVRTFMERSKAMPLKIHTIWHDNHYTEIVNPTMRILADHSSRWSEVVFFSDAGVLEAEVLKGIKGRLPLLRQLDIDFGTLDVFDDAPALTSVAICMPDYAPSLPYSQLIHMTLRHCYNDFVATRIFQQCRQVRRLELLWVENSLPIEPQVLMPSVDTLKVSGGEYDICFAIAHLLLPRLESLELVALFIDDLGAWEMWKDTPMVQSFFQQCSCITNLRIENLPLSDTQIITILTYVPTLRKLHIEDAATIPELAVDSPVNQTITPTSPSAPLIPGEYRRIISNRTHLTALFLKAHSRGFDSEQLVKMVSSRWIPRDIRGTCIDRVQVVEVVLGYDRDMPFIDVSALEPLVAAGLQLTVTMFRTKDHN